MTLPFFLNKFITVFLVVYLVEAKVRYASVLYTQKQFSEAVVKHPHIILFFSPTCPHSQGFFRIWEEFISERKLESEVKSAVVDCATDTDLCVTQNILAYPTIKFFHPALLKKPVRFRGERTVARIKHFLFDMMAKAFEEVNKPPTAVPAPEHFRKSVQLQMADWEKLTDYGSFFVKFFTPWCPVCQQLEPKWVSLAEQMPEHTRYSLGEVNCDTAGMLCDTNYVAGYPTLIFFHNGIETNRYKGSMDVNEMQAFIDNCVSIADQFKYISVGAVPEWVAQVPSIDVQNEAEFHKMVSENRLVFVKFHVPWCRYCRELQPKWMEMSRLLMRDHPNRVAVVSVDCVLNRQLCSKLKVRGYPTMVLYRDGQLAELYRGPRDTSALVNFLVRHMQHDVAEKIEL